MSLEQRGAPMRACGKRYASAVEAGRSKDVLVNGHEIVTGCPCGGVHTRKPEKPRTPLKPGRDTGPSPEVKKAVYDRDGWCCACCGTFLPGRPHSVGHRKRRSQGVDNSMPNLLAFLGLGMNPLDPDDHHARIDSRRDPRDARRGLSLWSRQNPVEVPVEYATQDGLVNRWLTEDGKRVDYPPKGVSAA